MNEVKNNSAETANPVIDTARLTIAQLAAAGVREAAASTDGEILLLAEYEL